MTCSHLPLTTEQVFYDAPHPCIASVQRLDTILLPTLVIWGRKDGVVPLRVGKRLARDLPNSHLIVIDHCGHSPHTECPAEVISALKEFAQKTSGNVSLPNHPATS